MSLTLIVWDGSTVFGERRLAGRDPVSNYNYYTNLWIYSHHNNSSSHAALLSHEHNVIIHAVSLSLCILVNPRRACAARVTVVVLCVCLSVCLSVSIYSRTTGYEAAYERYQQLQCYKGRKNNVAILLKRLRSRDMAWKQAKKPICIMSTGLPRPGLARSTHRGRIKFLRGYVSKSSAAVNRPTHDHAASLWEVAS